MRHLLFATSVLFTLSLANPGTAQEAGVGVGGGVGASAGVGSDGGIGAGVGGGAGIGVGGGAGIGVGSNTGIDGGRNTGSASNAGVSGQSLGSVDDQLVVGAAVVSSDGAEIGTVTDIALDANRQVVITVDLADELGMSVDSIRIRAHSAVFVDPQVRLDVTKARFVSSLEAHLGAQAGGG